MTGTAIVPLLLAASGLGTARIPDQLAVLVLVREMERIPKDMILCAEVDHRDASATALASLRETGREVLPASKCRWVVDVHKGSYEIRTKQPVHFIAVWGARSLPDGTLELQAEEKYHGKWASHWTVHARQVRGEWEIVTFHLEWLA